MKLAVLLPGSDLKNRRGLMNAALSRLEYLERIPGYEIDVFALRTEIRTLHPFRSFKREVSCSDILFEGRLVHQFLKIEYRSNNRILRKPLKIYHQLTHRRLCDWEWQKSFAKYLKGYDVITAHFNDMAITAEHAHARFGTPFFVTWHGSDIHTIPFNDSTAKEKTIQCIEHAACNFFVSSALLQTSEQLTTNGRKEVLYNGVDSHFKRYDDEHRDQLRKQFGIESDEKVITFVGNLRPVKNAGILPDIFKSVLENYQQPVKFWIIGDGEERQTIETKLKDLALDCRLWGNQPNDAIPDFLNCTDVLVLPSMNEGLGLVAMEALSCEANVIGSQIGGIPEVISEEFCVPIGPLFVEEFARKVVQVLEGHNIQAVPFCMNWETTSLKESSFYNEAISKKKRI